MVKARTSISSTLFRVPEGGIVRISLSVLMKFVDHLSDHIVGTAAVYRYSSQPFEKSFEGFSENGVLAHPVKLSPQFKGDEHHDGKIPVGRMGGGDHHELGDIGECPLCTPLGNFEQKDGYPSNNGSHYRRVKDCIIQQVHLSAVFYEKSLAEYDFRDEM